MARVHTRFKTLTALAVAVLAGCGGRGGPPTDEAPDFEIYGVIEGFYGPPWSHQDRLDMLAFMGRIGLHDYVYAPKNDPFHLSRWQEPYPDEELRALEELVHAAERHGVVLWYAVSPGLSIRYSSEADYATLREKLESIAALGVGHFGLFLDDVPGTLTHAEDADVFPSLAQAHVHLTNRLHADLSAAGHRLMLTPTTYSDAWGDLDYVEAIGAGVDPGVPIVWTGPDVASTTITADTARAWGARLRRKPLLWDNFPVNDYARWRLFLGPLTGRDPELAHEVMGFLANPMNEAHASFIALATVAAYTADPARYDPRAAHRAAVTDLLGEAADAAQPLLELFGDNGWDENVFEPLFFLGDTIALAPIREALDRADSSLRSLASFDDPYPVALRAEATPIVARLRDRLHELTDQPSYRSGRDTLRYEPPARELLEVNARFTPDVDGLLDEWNGVAPVTLVGGRGAPTLRLAADADNLYLALRVTGAARDVRTGSALPEGDHVAIIVHPDVDDPIFRTTDPVLLAAPPSAGPPEVLRLTMNFQGFMAKWLRDNRQLMFTEFHVTTFGRPLPDSAAYRATTRRTTTGYTVEAAIPRRGADRLRLSVTVADRQDGRRRIFGLQERLYPINPGTYARVHLRSQP